MPTVDNAMYSNSRLKFVKAQPHTRPGKSDFILQSLSTDSTMDKGFSEWCENMAPQLKLVTAWDDQLQCCHLQLS